MYEAIFEASEHAIGAIKPGVSAASIDRIVREKLAEYGFEKQIKHSSGHGVGYSAIDHRAAPKLAKDSSDIIQEGMVMNIEPGIYFESFGGMRLCDMVLVTDKGAELLTPFQRTIKELNVNN
jgi:Xaa-Pro aminopeptidase